MKKLFNLKLLTIILLTITGLTIVNAKILIVYDDNKETVAKIIEGAKSVHDDEYVAVSIAVGEDKIKAQKTPYVIAIGEKSYNTAVKLFTDSKILYAMVSNPYSKTISSNTVAGLAFEPDPDFFFNRLKKVFPKNTKIGVPYVPQNSQKIIDLYKDKAGKYGLSLVTESADSVAKIPVAIKALAGKCDIIWGGPDDKIFTMTNLQIFASTSFSKKIPVVFNSNKNIEKGGTISILGEYTTIGKSLGNIIKKHKAGESPGDKVQFPLKTILVINMKTVGQLGLALPSEVIKPGPTTIIIFK